MNKKTKIHLNKADLLRLKSRIFKIAENLDKLINSPDSALKKLGEI